MRTLTLFCCGVAAAATLLAGCGGQAGDAAGKSPATPVVSSTDQLLAAFTSSDKQTAHIKFSVKTDQGTLESADATYRGGQNFGMRMSMDVDAAAMAGSQSAQAGKHLKMTIIIVGDSFYMKFPEMPEQATHGKPWVKLDITNNKNPLAKVFGNILEQAKQQSDPRAMLSKIKQAGTIDRHATEQLNGQRVTHYWLTLDTAKAVGPAEDTLRGVDPKTGQQLKEELQKQLARMPKTYPTQLWINEENLPVKFLAKIPAPTIGTTTVTGTYSDWGKPVTIKAPPADQVTTLQLPEGGLDSH